MKPHPIVESRLANLPTMIFGLVGVALFLLIVGAWKIVESALAFRLQLATVLAAWHN